MAKYYGVSGKRIKSVGNETYALSSGVNVVKKKIIKTDDAKTPEQVLQRSKIQNCVKAYKQIGPDFFKGCFPSIKKGNSVYNAFVKANIKNGSPLHKQYSEDPNIIGIGVKTISTGKLNGISFESFVCDGVTVYGLALRADVPTDGSATVADITESLQGSLGAKIKLGDFINMGGLYNSGVSFNNNADNPLNVSDSHFVYKKIVNFKTSTTDTTKISDKGFIVYKDDYNNSFLTVNNGDSDDPIHPAFFKTNANLEIGYCFCVQARMEGSKILSSKSLVVANNHLAALYTLIEANPIQQNGWFTTIAKIAIITSYLAKKIAEIIHDWPI